jgi:hypothetical protein
MTKLLIAALACALLIPAAATAKEPGGDTKVLFTPAPKSLKAGQAWKARFWFYSTNGEPFRVSGAKPTVTIRNAVTGKARTFRVAQVDSTYYAARIVFPSSGRWTVSFSFGPTMGGGSRRLTMLRIL